MALLTNENVADFDWNKPIIDPVASVGKLPKFSMGTSDGLQSWEDSNADHFSQFRPRSPSEFVENYSDCGSYNSDQSCLDDSDSDCEDEPDEESSCKVKEFGPKLVFKGDTAEAVEEPDNVKFKKIKSQEEQEIEEGLTVDEETYEDIEDLLSLSWEWNNELTSADMEEKSEELLRLHKNFLKRESLIPMNKEIPIVPPFIPKADKNVQKADADANVAENVNNPSGKILAESNRLASESQHMMELTNFLLGSYIDSSNTSDDKTVSPVQVSLKSAKEMENTVLNSVPLPLVLNSEPCSFSFDEQPDLQNHPGPSPRFEFKIKL